MDGFKSFATALLLPSTIPSDALVPIAPNVASNAIFVNDFSCAPPTPNAVCV